MKLSEAIRLGAALAPQEFASLATRDASGLVLSTCAFGAALHAVSELYVEDTLPSTATMRSARLIQLFPIVTVLRTCPAPRKGCVYWPDAVRLVSELVMHLNDNHRWTRERIADWIETVEVEEEAAHAIETETCAAAV